MKRAFFLSLFLVMAGCFVVGMGPAPVRADAAATCDPKGTGANACDPFANPAKDGNCAAGTVHIALPLTGTSNCVDNTNGGGAIINYLRDALRVLGGVVGMVIVLMLIIAGVQYITSAGEPSAIKAAKNRIVNAITALVLFLMMTAILQFLVPGGIL